MTLKESLAKTKGIVKVGCKSGSGYFFAGDISDEDALQVITDAAERELRVNKQAKKSIERFLLNHTQLKDNIIKTNIDRELNRFDKDTDKDRERLIKRIANKKLNKYIEEHGKLEKEQKKELKQALIEESYNDTEVIVYDKDKAEERIALELELEKKYKERWRKTFESKTHSLHRTEKRISKWKPALDREVKEDGYTPIFFEHYILVEGHIQGRYWDKDEYYKDKQH